MSHFHAGSRPRTPDTAPKALHHAPSPLEGHTRTRDNTPPAPNAQRAVSVAIALQSWLPAKPQAPTPPPNVPRPGPTASRSNADSDTRFDPDPNAPVPNPSH